MLTQWPREKAVIFPNGVKREIDIFVPPDAFSPNDPWSVGARRAWARHDLTGKRVFYAGIGAHGAEVIQALYAGCEPSVIILNDVVGHHLDICQRNIIDHHDGDAWFELVPAAGKAEHALRWAALSNGYRPDLVFGCLPQVPTTGRLTNEQIAHMYPVSDYPELKKWGLGLLQAVLDTASKVLSDDGIVSLVVSGRVPMSVTRYMFRRAGFPDPVTTHSWMVKHHPDTPLRWYPEEVILFSDPHGQQRIPRDEAEQERWKVICGETPVEDYNVYHQMFVVEATLDDN